jgi:hypothetical protein
MPIAYWGRADTSNNRPFGDSCSRAFESRTSRSCNRFTPGLPRCGLTAAALPLPHDPSYQASCSRAPTGCAGKGPRWASGADRPGGRSTPLRSTLLRPPTARRRWDLPVLAYGVSLPAWGRRLRRKGYPLTSVARGRCLPRVLRHPQHHPHPETPDFGSHPAMDTLSNASDDRASQPAPRDGRPGALVPPCPPPRIHLRGSIARSCFGWPAS